MTTEVQTNPKTHFVNMSPGKLSGMRIVTDTAGRFKVLAIDQSNSFKKFLRKLYEKEGQKREPNYTDIMNAKMEITEVLSKNATAVLLDVNYSARQSLNSGALARQAGLIVRLEASKDAGTPGELEPGWAVSKIKKMGGTAVKLLVYMDTEDKKYTESQMKFVKEVSAQCEKNDILLMTEELSFPKNGEDKKSPSYLARLPKNIFESTELIGPYTDILKLEFPADINSDSEAAVKKNLETLNEKAIRPWVLLSAGVKFDVFIKQVELAMKAGASGTMAGRAIFQEFFDYTTPQERRKFLETTGIERMKKINEIVDKYASPWQKKTHATKQELSGAVQPDWYAKGVTASGAGAQGEY